MQILNQYQCLHLLANYTITTEELIFGETQITVNLFMK